MTEKRLDLRKYCTVLQKYSIYPIYYSDYLEYP